jgi:hypothetical protein
LSDPSEAIESYLGKGLLIDTNLLVLFFVGLYSRKRISLFKRTVQFAPEDFDCLTSFMGRFKQVVTTPSILTEVSNMLGQLPSEVRFPVLQKFSIAIRHLQEHFTTSSELSQETCFPRFGLTDASIVRAAQGEFLVLTDDFRLAGYLAKRGIDALNFNHLRTYLLPSHS